MRLESILEMSHRLIASSIEEGDLALDGTLGNGHDALVLASRVGGAGRVIGFDLQEAAIEASRARLERAGLLGRVVLVRQGHETVGDWFRQQMPASRLAAAMFNLGYLPGSDPAGRVVTRTETTLLALGQVMDLLKPGGLLTVVVYPGHPGGKDEAEAVVNWARELPAATGSALWYQFLNRQDPPSLVAVRRS